MAAIELEEITKSYLDGRHRTPALSGLSLTVEPGRAVGLLGTNGAGKSTAVRILATLSRPDSGRATVAGFDTVGQAHQVRSSIGVALQDPCVYPSGRVRQVLRLHARLFGLDRSSAARRSDEVIELAGLTKVAGRRVKHLSGGTLRRLDLGLALVGRPPVLLLDEPTGSLDPFSRREIWRELARLRDAGTTVLLASQDLEEVEQLADRVVILDDGAVWRDDISAAEVRKTWASDVGRH